MDTWVGKLLGIKNILPEYGTGHDGVKLQKRVINAMEMSNAELSENARAVGLTSKYIFSQIISNENAEKIVSIIAKLNKRTEINSYKAELLETCMSIISNGESPTEMIIYSTKGLDNNESITNAINDILKELYLCDDCFIEAYINILKNWEWSSQVLLVINSCNILKLEELGEHLMQLVEKNVYVRKNAANAIVSMKIEQYYPRLVNIFTAMNIDSRDLSGMVLEIFRNMAKSSVEGARCILDGYIHSANRALNGVFTNALISNITAQDIDKLFGFVTSPNKSLQRKALTLLGKLKNDYVTEQLLKLVGNDSVDQKSLSVSIGYTKDKNTIDKLKQIVEDENNDLELRTSAIISIGNLMDKSLIPYIKSYLSKSQEFEIACLAALIQLGEYEYLLNIFNYVVNPKFEDKYVRSAVRELQRLRGINKEEINDSLNLVANKVLEKDNEFMNMNVLNILNRGMDNTSTNMLLDKLNRTSLDNVKIFIIEYFAKNCNNADVNYKNKIRSAFVKCSSVPNTGSVKDSAMKALKVINRTNESAPMEGGIADV